MHNPANHPPIINPMCAAPATRQQWLDPRPFRIAQPADPLHPKLLNQDQSLNHIPREKRIP
jgi:hypothetical protein